VTRPRFSLYVGPDKDLALDSNGHLVKDRSVATRCRICLTTEKRVVKDGEVISEGFWADPTLGSIFHLIRTLKQAEAECQPAAEDALKRLIDEGAIQGVKTRQPILNHETGFLGVPIDIYVDDDEIMELGLLPLGRA